MIATKAATRHGVKTFIYLCPARAIMGWRTMVAHGSYWL